MLKKYVSKALSLIAPALLVSLRSIKENYSLSKEPRVISNGFKFTGNQVTCLVLSDHFHLETKAPVVELLFHPDTYSSGV